jgi:arylformamidase
MIAELEIGTRKYQADLGKGVDCSLPVSPANGGIRAFHLGPVEVMPFRAGSFVGSVAEGGSANCDKISFYPHGNSTHTESIGHITPEQQAINDILLRWWFSALLITVKPIESGGDRIITAKALETALQHYGTRLPEALVVRSSSDADTLRHTDYSGTNPVYFEPEALSLAADCHFQHLLCDLPSVDREEDGGKMAAHKAWWRYPHAPRLSATITELMLVPGILHDGLYLLNLQTAPMVNDATPSRPVLYPLSPQP